MNVHQIVRIYLKGNGFDGLCKEDCGCCNDDLFPCESDPGKCVPGHQKLIKDEWGKRKWVIVPKK